MRDKFIKVEEIPLKNSITRMIITHIPTGIFVTGESKKKYQLKDELLEELGNRLRIPAGIHD